MVGPTCLLAVYGVYFVLALLALPFTLLPWSFFPEMQCEGEGAWRCEPDTEPSGVVGGCGTPLGS